MGELLQAIVRRVGRIAADHPQTRRVFSSGYRLFTPSVAKIRSGPAKGMEIRTAHANPGYLFGTTEPAAQNAMARNLRRGDVCYDLGANVGFFTLIAARAVGPAGCVYAFEPSQGPAEELRANIDLNRLSQVEVIQAAVADSVGEAILLEGQDSLSGRLDDGDPALRKALGGGEATVQTTTIDALGLRPPNFLKIDVEGAEHRVIEGARQTIEQHHPTILCEMHLEGLVEDAIAKLGEWLPAGYSIHDLDQQIGHTWAPHLLATPG